MVENYNVSTEKKQSLNTMTREKEGDITIVVAKRFLVKVEGQKVSLDDLESYVKAIDFRKLKKLP